MRRLMLPYFVNLIALASLAPAAIAQDPPPAKDAFGDPLPPGAIARVGTTRYRLSTSRGTHGFVMSPDGKRLAVLSANGEIEFWKLPEWIKERVIHARSISTINPPFLQNISFSADGQKILAFDGNQRQVFIIDAATGKTFKKLALGTKDSIGTMQLTLTHDQQTLVVSYMRHGDKTPTQVSQVWDVAKDKMRHAFETTGDRVDGRSSHAVSADGRWLAKSTGIDNPRARRFGDGLEWSLDIWDLGSGQSARKIATDTILVHLAFSPDGKWIAASNGQSLLRVYEAATGVEKHNLRLRRSPVHHLSFAPDGNSLYVADSSGKVMQWDHIAGELKTSFDAPSPSMVRQLAFQPDGKILALGNMGMDAIAFWEVTKGTLYSPANVPASVINGLQFSPQGDLFTASDDGMMAWWNPRTGAKLKDVKLEFNEFRHIDYYPGDILFDRVGFSPGYYPRGRGALVHLSTSADILAQGNGGMYSFFDLKTGKLLYDEDSSRSNGAASLNLLEGNAKAAALQGKKLRVWNARTGRDLDKFDFPVRDQEMPIRLAAAPSGKQFAVATANDQGRGRIVLWDAVQNRVVRDWMSQDRQEAMRFSRDSEWLALGGFGNRIVLARALHAKGEYLLPLGGRVDEVTDLAFSPDGRQLAAAAIVPGRDFESSRIYVFELASKKIRLELIGHPGGIIERLAYAHDAGFLASGASDTTAVVWRAGLRAFVTDKSANAPTASAQQLDERFTQMAGASATAAFQSMIHLVQTPAQTVKLLESKIHAAKQPDPGEKTIAQWILDLGNGKYAVRTKASDVLKKLGPAVTPDLQAALIKAPDIETKRRIEELLERFASHDWTADEILHSRAVELADAIATPDARALLTRWSTGDAGAILTRESRKALASRGP